ncbi:hypothetical protein PN36_30380 [Candidatus Thiomargarita nelsonii]|uniref:Uncharacterized protein n=1 Tax=Candidatus Thiomargarita nelsonii TaxID=1003181 RepID=A0A4E0QK64_9GAMM|nr:hypothetical protein PN36_30380 [Candidatus Thiomargarita nelsonii]
MNTEKRFAEAENSWDLERLYTDLGKAKGKFITKKNYICAAYCVVMVPLKWLKSAIKVLTDLK